MFSTSKSKKNCPLRIHTPSNLNQYRRVPRRQARISRSYILISLVKVFQLVRPKLFRDGIEKSNITAAIPDSREMQGTNPERGAAPPTYEDIIREKCKELILSEEQLRQLMKTFHHEILQGLGKKTHDNATVKCFVTYVQDLPTGQGLGKKTHDNATVKCFVTYVQDLPTGREKGKFLALDLGGTNFRVLLIELSENHFEMKSKIFAIPQHIMLGSGEQLFDHIADCLAKFMKEENIMKERLALGDSIVPASSGKGLLKSWTKGFNCSGVVGNDVVQLLRDAIKRRGDISIDIFAILNDTTGTLMSCAWKNQSCRIGLIVETDEKYLGTLQFFNFHPDRPLFSSLGLWSTCTSSISERTKSNRNCGTGTLMSCAWKNQSCRIGLIVGTGSNACYVEKQKNAELFDEPDMGSGQVLINVEWGAFGDNGVLDFVRTQYDKNIDQHSINVGQQLFEKMISGMYMGEIVRQALERFTKEGLLFGGKGSDLLFTRGRFYTKYVSEIESDYSGVYTNCREILEELGLKHATEQDCVNVRFVCECVSRRAAHLVSAALCTLLNKMNEPHVTVGIDGSVYRFHPHFHNLMMEKISHLINPHLKFDLMLSEDGSGRGAALVAACASAKKR
ncbi:Hexokinase [Popillia japonica]|uniref:Phosphotransferase n=1 Tax=Popillia japonica TaxID=7064 RepID=A0AAW1MUZ7_POPJA